MEGDRKVVTIERWEEANKEIVFTYEFDTSGDLIMVCAHQIQLLTIEISYS